MNPYYTHQKYLIEELNKLDFSKPVLVAEIGTGDGSSSIFQSFAIKYPNLRIDSFESDFDWFRDMSEKYPANNYYFHHVSWGRLALTNEYDLAFVDNGLDFESRIKIIDSIKAKVILLHDYDYYNKGIIEDIFSVSEGSFFERFNKDYTLRGNYEILPPTLIMQKI
jgi:hypothetical protein